jgi:hypothetical protein
MLRLKTEEKLLSFYLFIRVTYWLRLRYVFLKKFKSYFSFKLLFFNYFDVLIFKKNKKIKNYFNIFLSKFLFLYHIIK